MTRLEIRADSISPISSFKSGSLANDVFHKVPNIVVPRHNCIQDKEPTPLLCSIRIGNTSCHFLLLWRE